MKWMALLPVLWVAITIAGCNADGSSDAASQDAHAAQDHEPIHNLHKLSDRLYSGAQPEGDAAFAHLASLGVKTILTVDGAKPDVEGAARHGIRYIHLPVGYDGIEPEQQVRIVAAAREFSSPDEPMFIHCHHGKHRGPTAAAICAVTLDGWTDEQAVTWMRDTGKTSPDYAGLYATARDFKKPTEAQLDAAANHPFPQVAEPGNFVDAMVTIDHHWDNLKAVRAAGWWTPDDHPDIDPPHEALLLAEHYRELARMLRAKGADKALINKMADAERLTMTLREHLGMAMRSRNGKSFSSEFAVWDQRASDSFDAVGASCTSCHKSFRD